MKTVFSVLILMLSYSLVAQVPSITSFNPSSGPIGTVVTITGTNFNTTPASNIVYFGAVKATVSAATSTTIVCTVPVGATYQPVSVATNGLIAYSTNPFRVTYTGGGATFNASSFAAATSFAGGGFMAEGDLSGDGKADVVFSHFSGGYIQVYKNTTVAGGPVSFSSEFFQFVTNPICVKTADINGDGWLDIIIANSTFNVVYVMRNNTGSGFFEFATPVSFGTGAEPRKLTVDDIDKDGKADIITANQSGNSISILRNTSVGNTISFAAKVDFTTASTPEGVNTGDLDGDGKTDIVVACAGADAVSVFKNISTSGTISMEPKVDFTTGDYPWDAAAADIDGDNKMDLIASNLGSSSISVLRNTTSGTISFATHVQFSTTASPRGLVITDFDADGKPDVASANWFSSSNVAVLKNTSVSGSLSFDAFNSYASGTGPSTVIAGDFDSDGLMDMMTSNSQVNTLSFFKNQLPVISAVPSCPALLMPINNAVVDFGTPVLFKWRTMPNATGYRVRFIEQSGAYTELNTTDTSYLFTPAAGVNYTWNVTPHNMPFSFTSCVAFAFSTCPVTTTSITINATGSTDKCALDSVKLTATSGINIQWFRDNIAVPDATSDIYWAKLPGTYKVREVNGTCYGTPTNSITITNLPTPVKPSLTASGPLTFCEGGSVTLTSSLVNINNQWVKNTIAIPGANGDNYIVNQTGAYFLRVTNSTSGCHNYSDTANVVVNTIPAVPTVTASGPLTFCAGGSVTLTSSAASGNQWVINGNNIFGGTGTTYIPNLSGNYTVTATNNGCTSAASAVTTVTINDIPATPVVTAGGSTSLCTGGNVTFTSNSATGNQWYNGTTAIAGATNATYVASTAGTYSVRVTQNGCTSASSNTFTVVVNTPPAVPTVSWNGNQLNTVTGFAGYQWFLNNNSIAGGTTAAHTPASSGLYKVRITDANGCTATSTEFNLVATGINDITLNGVKYSISPNPAKADLFIRTGGNNPYKVQMRMINSNGAEVLSKENIRGTTTISVTHLPAGIYYIMLSSKKENGVFKIVINR